MYRLVTKSKQVSLWHHGVKCMSLDTFEKQSGFKVLAMARLGQVEYSIVLYLINCAASKLDEVITTDAEISSLIGYEQNKIRHAIEQLHNRNIIKLKYGTPHANPDIDSLRIGMQFNLNDWHLDFEKDVTHNDAVVFPFRRHDQQNLIVCADEEPNTEQENQTWERVLKAFIEERVLEDDELKYLENSAKTLVETHPVDQVLLMVRHFQKRIPTLSLLASSWQHYQELFESETQKVNFSEARQKHHELENKLRTAATELIKSESYTHLSEEEKTVLDVLVKHRHPRRQLFWAYQTRSRYPNLSDFFNDNSKYMIAVTSSGKVLTKTTGLETP